MQVLSVGYLYSQTHSFLKSTPFDSMHKPRLTAAHMHTKNVILFHCLHCFLFELKSDQMCL